MIKTEKGDKAFPSVLEDGFQLVILRKEEFIVDDQPTQDVCRLGLKPSSAIQAYNRLRNERKYTSADGKATLWISKKKLHIKMNADYFQ